MLCKALSTSHSSLIYTATAPSSGKPSPPYSFLPYSSSNLFSHSLTLWMLASSSFTILSSNIPPSLRLSLSVFPGLKKPNCSPFSVLCSTRVLFLSQPSKCCLYSFDSTVFPTVLSKFSDNYLPNEALFCFVFKLASKELGFILAFQTKIVSSPLLHPLVLSLVRILPSASFAFS